MILEHIWFVECEKCVIFCRSDTAAFLTKKQPQNLLRWHGDRRRVEEVGWSYAAMYDVQSTSPCAAKKLDVVGDRQYVRF